jgi:hypothetical protein
MRREDIIREMMTMVPPGFDGFQICKSILKLSETPPGTFVKIGPRKRRRAMSQSEAQRLVAAAVKRIEQVDQGD